MNARLLGFVVGETFVARDRINKWSGLDFYNPTKVLREARRQGYRHELGGRAVLPREVRHTERRTLAEYLDAAVFAHGIRQLIPERDVCFAEFEAQDHDFILRFGPADDPKYCPLQLKVLVSTDVSSAQTPEILLDGLRKYGDASDLVVAVKVDRPGVDPRTFEVPALQVGELWFFGPRSGTDDGWYLYGDCLAKPQWFEFELSWTNIERG